jgi:DNA-binding beta-propeller fold protein YncE
LCGAQAAILPAQIAVSANDGKQRPADSPNEPLTPDSLTVLDLGSRPVRVLASVSAPASLVGPPASVALSHDSRFAIVTAATKLDSSGAVVPGDGISVVDLAHPSHPRIIARLHAGAGASGVAINPAGTLALVANANADSISVFEIRGQSLFPLSTLALDPKSRPVDLGFSKDGRSAYVVAQGANALLRLAIDRESVALAPGKVALGSQPYSLSIDPTTRVAFVSHLGARTSSSAPGPKVGTVGVVDLREGRMVEQLDAGIGPEHVGLSPSGRFLEATINNGTTAPLTSPAYHKSGLMIIYRVEGMHLVPAAQTQTGGWCQGATWSSDEKLVLLQCAAAKQIEIYRFDGRSLVPGGTLQLDARPGAIATAASH